MNRLRLATLTLLACGLAAGQQQTPILRGTIQQNQGVQADEIAAGGCGWNTGACNMLKAYVTNGGSKQECLVKLNSAVDVERKEQNLGKNAKQSASLDQQMGSLEKQRDRILQSLPPDCFGGGRKPNYPTGYTAIPDPGGRLQKPPGPVPNLNPRTTRSPSNPIKDGLNYAHGIADGIGNCVQGFYDLFGAAALMAQGAARMAQGDMSGDEFVRAASLLGLQPGESVTLRSIMSEVQTQVLGVSPYEAGVIAGRRICGYAIAPAAMKGAGSLARRLPGAVRGAIGQSPANPFRGPALAQAVSDAPNGLPGNWIAGKMPPVQLGNKLGSGSFGTVFKLPKTPNAIKIGNSTPESAPSFARQVKGAELLKQAQVPTPEIHYWEDPTASGAGGNPGIIIMDDVYEKYPGAQQMSLEQLKNLDGAGKAGPYLNAIRVIDNKLVEKSLVAIDNSPSNIAFVPDGSGAMLGVFWDADMVMPVSDFLKGLNDSNNIATGVFKAVMQNRPDLLSKIMNAPATSSREVMDALFEARYSDLQNISGSTSSGTVPGGGRVN
jgi:hypothetical protein